MAGTAISGGSVTSANLQMSFRSQYVTASLNEKMRAMPRGVVRGFTPVPGAGTDQVDLVVDDLQSDSVMVAVGSANSKIHALTYRVDTTVTLDFTALNDVGGVRYYVAFVPNYAIGNTTDGEWRAYTEAEFEAGNIEGDGGVLVFAIELPDVDAIPEPEDILMAGQSTTTFKTFMREDQEDWVQASGGRKRRLALSYVPMPFDVQDDDLANTITFDDVDYIHGRGSLQYATTLNADIPPRIKDARIDLWTNASGSKRAKVIVQYWYKTDVTFASVDFGLNLTFYDETGASITSAEAENAAGRAPTYRNIPDGDSGGWKMIRWECTVPDPADHGGSKAQHCALFGKSVVISAGTLRLGPVQVFVEAESSPQEGFGDFSGDMTSRPVVTGSMFLGDDLPGLPADSQYWKVTANGQDVVLQPRPLSGVNARTWEWGSSSYGGNQRLRLRGDGTDGSYIEAFGSGIKADRYVQTPEIRRNATGIGDLPIRDDAAADGLVRLLAGGFRANNTTNYLGTPGTTPPTQAHLKDNAIAAWAIGSSDGVGGYTLDMGYGISAVANSAGDLQFTFQNTMNAANEYVVLVTYLGITINGIAQVNTKGTASFRVRTIDDTGTFLSVAVNAISMMVAVIGKAA